MKNILAIGGSLSAQSINRKLATYSASLVSNSVVTTINLNDYELPMYCIDLEKESGIPENALALNKKLDETDAIIISLAEHNGAYTAGFKNAFDWLSRIDKSVWKNKPMLLMATSPGARGAQTVLQLASTSFPHLGGNIIATYSLPSFHDNFNNGTIVNPELLKDLNEKIEQLNEVL